MHWMQMTEILKKFETGAVSIADPFYHVSWCNGMSSPAVIDVNFDGVIDYVYAGDLNGNLWKFDLRDADNNNWAISYGGHPMYQAIDPYGTPQMITSEPDVMKHCDDFRSGLIVTLERVGIKTTGIFTSTGHGPMPYMGFTTGKRTCGPRGRSTRTCPEPRTPPGIGLANSRRAIPSPT